MAWYDYVAHFLAGGVFANSLPHLVHGVSGRRFPSPFGSPPGVGPSSATLNVVWAALNLGIGYVLLTGVGHFMGGLSTDALVFGLGALLMALRLATRLAQLQRLGKGMEQAS